MLEDMLANDVRPRQILVEFHHFLPGIPKSRTQAVIRLLKRAGYSVGFKKQLDYSFYRR